MSVSNTQCPGHELEVRRPAEEAAPTQYKYSAASPCAPRKVRLLATSSSWSASSAACTRASCKEKAYVRISAPPTSNGSSRSFRRGV
eukprot:scaffold11559_cov67-Phaeocystis_antarctica.AAC.5